MGAFMFIAKHELKFIELARKGYYKVLESGKIFRSICKYCGSDCFNKAAYAFDACPEEEKDF
jgi:hypothetical protein